MSTQKSIKPQPVNRTTVAASPDPSDPTSFPRRILLAVTGLSPQIVTETLYALAKPSSGEKPFYPTEIQLITTETGRQKAIDALLRVHDRKPGWFHRLCADHGLPLIRFDDNCILVVPGPDGKPLDDIRTQEDSECVADFITDTLCRLARDSSTALHVSLAGGRKTMGFYMGYAMSLFARQQDRLSHVLVSAPYEGHDGFFYPTADDQMIKLRDESTRNARDAKVVLASIPVVSLRRELPKQLQSGHVSYTQMVKAMQAVLAPPELVVDVDDRLIKAGGKVMRLQPTQFAIFALLAYQTVNQLPALTPPPRLKPATKYVNWSSAFTKQLKTVLGELGLPRKMEGQIVKGVTGDYLSPLLAKLRKQLAAQLGTTQHAYRIDDGSKKPKCYQLTIAPECIRFEHLDPPPRRKTSKR
jgi:CRISPR-associated protein (TIGR02584 family)